MRLNLLNISRRTATLGFLALFPGFLLYHYSVAQGWIPPFLGGLFGIASLALAGMCLLLLPWMYGQQLRPALLPAVMVLILVAFYTLWAVANYALTGEAYTAAALTETAAALGTWLAGLVVGIFFPFRASRMRLLLAVMGILIVLAMAHAMVRFRSPLGPFLTFSGADEASGASTYQGIGRSIVVTTIFLAAVAMRMQVRFFVFAAGALLLILVGSRTDLFTMVGLTMVLVGLVVIRSGSAVTAGVVLVATSILVYLAAPLFLETRSAEILDLASSSSWQARGELQAHALRIIGQHPLFGVFGYHFRDGGSGFYAHNALSAWTNYGLLGFVLYLGLIIYFTVVSLRRMFGTGVTDPAWFAAFQLNLASLIQALAAAPVFAPLPALAWGVTLNAMRGAADDGPGADPAA